MGNRLDNIIRRILLLKDGSYKFFMKRILNYDSTVYSNRLIQSEYFKNELKVVDFDIDAYKKILVLAPHQDDELIGPGGLLLKAKNNSSRVNIIFFTDGNQPNNKIATDIVKTRQDECDSVCNRLNADYCNINISNLDYSISKEQYNSVANFISNFSPDLILAPWFLDPASHRFVNYLAASVLKNIDSSVEEVLCYETHNQPFPNAIVNITDEINEKLRLLQIYESQIYDGLRYDHMIKGKNAYNSKFLPYKHEKKTYYAELYCRVPMQEYINLSIISNDDFNDAFEGNRNIISSLNKINRWSNNQI